MLILFNVNIKSVFVLDRKLHRRLHNFLTYDEETKMFKTKKGLLLNTKMKHEAYSKLVLAEIKSIEI